MRVIFLDFDGVLNGGWRRGVEFNWCLPSAVRALNWLTAKSGAEIVVSSAWRHNRSLPGLVRKLREWGVTGKVIGATKRQLDYTEGLDEPRSVYIAEWLRRHPQVRDYAILDDNNIFLSDDGVWYTDHNLADRFVQTQTKVGLTMNDAKMAAQLLRGW